MSRFAFTRRQFLTLPLTLVFGSALRALAATELRRAEYVVDVGVLYDVMSFRLAGTVEESVDRGKGRYEVKFAGEGKQIANLVESRGMLRGGRWAPSHATSLFQVAGRESRSEINYDYERRTIDYHYRGETFLLRRRRVADDVVRMPETGRIDDVISATLNYGDGLWPPERDGSLQTWVVRRRRREDEGPDDVDSSYGAELVPFVLRVMADRGTGKPMALFDMTRFSSWAKADRPARVQFGFDRRPEAIFCSLVLGTSVTIRFTPHA